MSLDDVTAIETISRNCFRSFAALPNAELIDDGKIFGVMSHLAVPFFSGIATSLLGTDEVEGVVDRFREKKCAFRWWLTPSTRPRELESILIAQGMSHAYDAPGMLADLTTVPLDAPLPHGITIRRLTHVGELKQWLDVFTAVFSTPEQERAVWLDAYVRCGVAESAPWQHFVAFEGEIPVATTSVLTVGDLAGVYFVATLEEVRGRGIGAAVTREAMRYARAAGATRAALQSSELGYGVYRALGFVEHCQLRLYHWRPES